MQAEIDLSDFRKMRRVVLGDGSDIPGINYRMTQMEQTVKELVDANKKFYRLVYIGSGIITAAQFYLNYIHK